MTTASANAATTNAPELWSIDECAKFLGKSPRWLWSAIVRRPTDKGSIPHVRIGRTPRFLADQILEWVRMDCPPAATFAQWKKPGKSCLLNP